MTRFGLLTAALVVTALGQHAHAATTNLQRAACDSAQSFLQVFAELPV
jgi:hypothetical protein